jgi:hypothetical protein
MNPRLPHDPVQNRPGESDAVAPRRTDVNERLEERDGGVYVELETVALSRGIPIEFRWLIKPLTDELPRKMMVEMLDDTRAALANGEYAASNGSGR